MDWIVSILGSSRLSVLINGSPTGYFSSSIGLRQRGPLFPLLFGVVEDFLSRLLSRMVESDQLLPISSPRVFFALTHLLHVDDVSVFCRIIVKNLKSVMLAFRIYGSISGQLVNWSKSSIIFESLISLTRISSLQSLVGIQIGRFPFSYLGVPLFWDKPRKAILMPIADKILSKFAKWKGKSLSLAGLATLIRSMITGSFVCSFMVYKWSTFLTKMVTKKIINFLWTGSCEERKLVHVAWNRCCKPYDFCGLGLKDLALLNGSLLRKLTWKLLTSNNFSFTFLHDRLPTDDLLFRSGFRLASRCSVCGASLESVDHLFLKCPLAADLWESIFEGKSADFRVALSLVCYSVYDENSLGIGCMRNCVDDLLILHWFGLYGRSSKATVIRSVVWLPPAPRWIKVNTDGVTLGWPDVGGCGGVFRTCRSFVKACFAVPLGQVFTFEAELLAASLAINYAWNLGWHRIWLESDSSYIV
ncbi:hypothetical protein Ddye_020045 [Dipteronia dyeriana]|uniref:RNase H type-1 domain-containing protein n=1 Tax=Dipteronia dyeriana TaxID=168575 RepID=A0AAD9WWP1_9ROSI|nr:hypothetical protein Ddye_020045 [Dipteronia dyeriana]